MFFELHIRSTATETATQIPFHVDATLIELGDQYIFGEVIAQLLGVEKYIAGDYHGYRFSILPAWNNEANPKCQPAMVYSREDFGLKPKT